MRGKIFHRVTTFINHRPAASTCDCERLKYVSAYIHRNLKLFHTQWRPQLNSLSVLYRGYDLLSKRTWVLRVIYARCPTTTTATAHIRSTNLPAISRNSSTPTCKTIGLKEPFNFRSSRFRKPRAPLIESLLHAFRSLLLLHPYRIWNHIRLSYFIIRYSLR